MPDFAIAHVAANDDTTSDWAPLAGACLRELGEVAQTGNLGFVYLTDAFADRLGDVTAFLRSNTAIEAWVGTVGIGIAAGSAEYFDRPAMAMMAARLPADSFRLLPNLTGPGAPPRAVGAWAKGRAPVAGVVHADPRCQHVTEVVGELARGLPAFLVGGLTSSRKSFDQIAGGEIVTGGVSGVLLGGEIAVAAGLSQGCSPIGPRHRITAAQDNLVFELGERRALDVLKAELDKLSAEERGRMGGNIHVALPVSGSDTGDYLVRNLMGVDPRVGAIAIGERVQAGDALMFCRRDRAAAIEDLTRMLGRLKRRLSGPPRAGLYFSCIARGPNLFGPNAEEMALLRRELGEFPVIGMFCNGEISNDRLYGYTGVLLLFV